LVCYLRVLSPPLRRAKEDSRGRLSPNWQITVVAVPISSDIHVIAVPVVIRGRGSAAQIPVICPDLVPSVDGGKGAEVETPYLGRLHGIRKDFVGSLAIRVDFGENEVDARVGVATVGPGINSDVIAWNPVAVAGAKAFIPAMAWSPVRSPVAAGRGSAVASAVSASGAAPMIPTVSRSIDRHDRDPECCPKNQSGCK
jgi:hypothetical protein